MKSYYYNFIIENNENAIPVDDKILLNKSSSKLLNRLYFKFSSLCDKPFFTLFCA